MKFTIFSLSPNHNFFPRPNWLNLDQNDDFIIVLCTPFCNTQFSIHFFSIVDYFCDCCCCCRRYRFSLIFRSLFVWFIYFLSLFLVYLFIYFCFLHFSVGFHERFIKFFWVQAVLFLSFFRCCFFFQFWFQSTSSAITRASMLTCVCEWARIIRSK